jgi:hypothetical protein
LSCAAHAHPGVLRPAAVTAAALAAAAVAAAAVAAAAECAYKILGVLRLFFGGVLRLFFPFAPFLAVVCLLSRLTYKRLTNAYKRLQTPQTLAKSLHMLQTLANAYKRLQTLTNAYKRLQTLTKPRACIPMFNSFSPMFNFWPGKKK